MALCRILGNDLPPLEAPGETLARLRIVLEQEPAHAACQTLWVVNRIHDPDQERALLQLLEAHGQEVLHRPFSLEEHGALEQREPSEKVIAHLKADPGSFDGWDLTPWLGDASWSDRKILAQIHVKALHATDLNAARNEALEWGRARAEWTLVQSAGCFHDGAAFERLCDDLKGLGDGVKHACVDAAQLSRREFSRGPRWLTREEPAGWWLGTERLRSALVGVAFRRDSTHCFDDSFRQDRRPLAELLCRLGVAGAWDEWDHMPARGSSEEIGPEVGRLRPILGLTRGPDVWAVRHRLGVHVQQLTTALARARAEKSKAAVGFEESREKEEAVAERLEERLSWLALGHTEMEVAAVEDAVELEARAILRARERSLHRRSRREVLDAMVERDLARQSDLAADLVDLKRGLPPAGSIAWRLRISSLQEALLRLEEGDRKLPAKHAPRFKERLDVWFGGEGG